MKRTIILFATILLTTLAFNVHAQQYKLRHDSLHVYLSWESMFDGESEYTILNPDINAYTDFDVEFDGIKKELRKLINDQAVAVALGDSLWYINSKYLKQNFKGDCKRMRDYVPLYFSAKIAFIQWGAPRYGFYVSEDAAAESIVTGELYLIDFDNKRVDKITPEKLSDLLSFYPDLRRRYEGMYDYQWQYVITDFFLQYVKRINDDPNVPYLEFY